jgi:hypothetical protein
MPTENNPKNKTSAPASAAGSFVDKLKKLGKLDFTEMFKPKGLKKIFASSNKFQSNQENLKVLEMDLIKDEVVISFDWREHLISLFLFLILAALLVGEAYYVLFLWGRSQEDYKAAYLKTEINQTTDKISQLKDVSNQAFNFKNKLATVQPIFKQHVYWSNFFNFLQTNTLKDVYFLNFKGGIDGDYTLASKVKDYRAVESQLKAMRVNNNTLSATFSNENFDNASSSAGLVSGNTVANPGASFDLNLKLKPEIFFK